MGNREHHFYGKPILAGREKDYIEKILAKYKNEKADEKLKEKIWNELQVEKFLGNLSIPFKVVLRKDEYRKYPDRVEIILDTKL